MSLAIGSREIIAEPRPLPPRSVRILVPVLSLFVGILVGAIALLAAGHDPVEAFNEVLNKGFLGKLPLIGTLVLATPLILTGLAAVVSFRMKIWNIGAEGQLLIGGIAGSGTALALGDHLPGPIIIVVALLASVVAGAFWAALAALPRAYLNTDEVITTLMLNFVALSVMNYLIFSSVSFWRNAERLSFPSGRFIPDTAFLPRFWGRLHIGIFIAIAVAAVLWWVLRSTKWGFEVEVTGDSPRAAEYAGIRVDRKIVSVLLASGGLAGLAGGIEISGALHNLDPRALGLGVGFTGIVVAAIARLSPLGTVVVAILVAGLANAAVGLQGIGIPSDIVVLLEGIFFLCVVGGEYFLHNTIRIRSVDELVGRGESA
jgi:ABC-type uncharacterized transport system permease subunit